MFASCQRPTAQRKHRHRLGQRHRENGAHAAREKRLRFEPLEVRCLLSVSYGPRMPLPSQIEPAGGPFPNQSQTWAGYQEAVPAVSGGASGGQDLISGVPAYLWHNGCGPTSAGMILGYWDMHGYSNLIPGDSSTETTDVDNAIAGDEHYNDYSLPLDDPGTGLLLDKSSLGGAHANDCIADWMHTSWSSDQNMYGWTWYSQVPGAIESYAAEQGYSGFTATNEVWGNLTWDNFKAEIDAGRPVELLVDTTGSDTTDHFVPAIGYDDTNHLYACYDTWSTTVHWYDFAPMAPGQLWGIYGATFVDPPAIGQQPAVSSLNPAAGPAQGGTSVTIAGSGFTGATAVDFGSIAATAFTVVSDTQITATSPAGLGKVDVTVTTPGGTSSTSMADQFTYQLDLKVTTLTDKLDTNYDPANLSLREALALTNSNAGGDNSIWFDSSLDGGTISLSLGEMAITDSVGIEGLGSGITIDAGGQSRIFNVDDGQISTGIDASDVNIVGLTLTGGSADDGGADLFHGIPGPAIRQRHREHRQRQGRRNLCRHAGHDGSPGMHGFRKHRGP